MAAKKPDAATTFGANFQWEPPWDRAVVKTFGNDFHHLSNFSAPLFGRSAVAQSASFTEKEAGLTAWGKLGQKEEATASLKTMACAAWLLQ